MSTQYPKRPSEIPNKKHWAIIKFKSTTIPGDERSRTAPGHGYPKHTKISTDYLVYTDRNEWVEEIERLMSSQRPEPFKATEVHPVEIKKEISVTVI